MKCTLSANFILMTFYMNMKNLKNVLIDDILLQTMGSSHGAYVPERKI